MAHPAAFPRPPRKPGSAPSRLPPVALRVASANVLTLGAKDAARAPAAQSAAQQASPGRLQLLPRSASPEKLHLVGVQE
eukprot:15481746-Alexandrium_andersonii.AAC.1